jgi:hypothetical protein
MLLWIKVEEDITRHPKMVDLSNIVGMPSIPLSGYILTLFSYCMRYYQSGIIFGADLEHKIARQAAQWPGDPTEFVDALVRTRWLHRTEDAPAVCDECFGEFSFYQDLPPHSYVLHGWEDRYGTFLREKDRTAERRKQDRERKRRKRAVDRGEIREPEAPYFVVPRGLRKSPLRVRLILQKAAELAKSRAEALNPEISTNTREDQQDSLSAGRHAEFQRTFSGQDADNMRTGCGQVADTVRTNSEKRSIELTNVRENEQDSSFPRPCGHLADNMRTFPAKKKNKNHLLNSKTSLVVSLRDRETPKDGPEAGQKSAFSNPNSETDLDHQTVINQWSELHLTATQKKTPEDLGRLGRAAKIWRDRGYPNSEIVKRMRFYFGSPASALRNGVFAIGDFQKRFPELESGPLREMSVAAQRRDDGGFDRATGNEEYKPDF